MDSLYEFDTQKRVLMVPKARINLAKFLKINYKFIKFIINFDVTVRR